LPIFAQHLIGSQKILKPMSAAEAASPTTPNVTIVKSSSQEIDSLSVAPVNFDWQSSGLSNPLTSAGGVFMIVYNIGLIQKYLASF
jgi:hypothetical protein